MLLDVSYSVTSQGLQRMRRTTQFQSTCPCRLLSFLRCRKKWGKWSFLEQSETNNIINDQIHFFQNKTCWFQAWHPGDRTQQGVRVDDHDNLGGRQKRPPCFALVAFFNGFWLTRCASSIWRAPIGASGQWCHSIGFRWRYDGHIKSVFGYRLFSTFKCSSVTTSIQLQLVNETFPWEVCVVDSKSLSQVLFGTRALGTNQSWVWGSDIASQGTTKTERWIQYCKSTAFPSPVLIAKCSGGVPPGRFAKINSHWNWTREQLAVGDPWGFRISSRISTRASMSSSGWDRWEKLRRIWLAKSRTSIWTSSPSIGAGPKKIGCCQSANLWIFGVSCHCILPHIHFS